MLLLCVTKLSYLLSCVRATLFRRTIAFLEHNNVPSLVASCASISTRLCYNMWKIAIILSLLSLAGKCQQVNQTSPASQAATMNFISQKMHATKKAPTVVDEEKITILCRNRSSSSFQPVTVNDKQVMDKLDFRKPLALIVHGWNGNISKPFMRNLTQNYMLYVDSNLCLVEWSSLAACEYSVVFEQGVKKVVNHLTRFVRFVHRNGMAYDDITLVGHSLGAHIAGLVGKNLDGQIGAIYALDPAGVLFTFPLDVGEEKRLAPTDAQYVQAIYTSSGTLAMSIAAGHQNFWVNKDGAHPQPGCEDASTETDEFERMYGMDERLIFWWHFGI